ncbi:uncharacterized protein N7484_008431 [Penicillium longicatenatum]|uniref:uncharacterized protein n=1 Tax=Penicillium longicatenatum TaxID=1561947 RepID=UPI002547D592|nr:uncharacterized protein N7484_008431 [Penicillium longicatenatum]KAJ5635118.1 hypothetical protein N7484_008431 [Penicillium longicatenatum]
MLAPNFHVNAPVPPDPVGKAPTYSPDEVPSCGGHGTLEILEVTRYLEKHGIECCIVGVSALIFYGAGRVRDEWELCVPDDKVGEAVALLSADSMAHKIHAVPPIPIPQPSSLSHTYHRFKGRGIHFYFLLVPAYHAHIPCGPFRIRRSLNGVPYPTLPVLMQSFLDTNDDVSLCDCIDGSNVSEEWGVQNLNLDGSNDLEWTRRMNIGAAEAARGKGWMFVHYFPTSTISRREQWELRVRNKKGRLGWTTPETIFETRFRLRGSPDPWTQKLISS